MAGTDPVSSPRTEMSHGNDLRLPVGAQFHENLATGWNANYSTGGFKRRLDLAGSLLRKIVNPDERWLDDGCGSGTLTGILGELGAAGDAIDGSPAMIDAAIDRAKRDPRMTRFSFRRVETIERLDMADNLYDGVLCSSVIEYLESPARALSEISRVLKPGGRMLLSVASRYSVVRNLQGLFRAVGATRKFRYLEVSRTTYSRSGIREVLRKYGMEVDDVRQFDPLLPRWSTTLLPPSLIFVTGTKRPPAL